MGFPEATTAFGNPFFSKVKKVLHPFALPSFFRNIGYAELT